jgi:DNA-directed RNA polymerase specialized sigma24 family protein
LKVQDFSETELLREWSRGDRAALDQLIPLIHTDLHAIARRRLHSMAPGSSMQATALVNEVYLRLVDSGSVMSTFATAPISLRSAPP